MRLLTTLSFVALGFVSTSASAQAFLAFPLECDQPAKSCKFKYSKGAYTPGTVNSVLDHSMKKNASGAWPYGKLSSSGGDGVIVAFTGERANGTGNSRDETCIKGKITLNRVRPIDERRDLVKQGVCPTGVTGFASYDEHPGYDYRAAIGTTVKAAAAGRVLNIKGQRCYIGNIGSLCENWGWIGIDHGNGYITQYGHMSRIDLAAGDAVKAGQVIGLSGDTGVRGSPHLHFEVLKKVNSEYYYVDPYGWTGLTTGLMKNDPLYSVSKTGSAILWK